MRRSFRIVTLSASILVFCAVLISWNMDGWIARFAEDYVNQKSHFSLQIGELETDLIRGVIDIRNIQLKNSSAFPDSRFLHINSLKVQWVWSSLFSHRLHLREAVVDIAEFAGVRNRNGAINIETFANSFKEEEKTKNQPEQTPTVQETPRKEFLIDRLFFQLENVTIADFHEGKHDVKSSRIGLRRVFNNVTDYPQVVVPLAADLSLLVAGFILDSVLHSTLDIKTYQQIIHKITAPIKETLEKTKKETEKTLDRLFKEILPSSKEKDTAP